LNTHKMYGLVVLALALTSCGGMQGMEDVRPSGGAQESSRGGEMSGMDMDGSRGGLGEEANIDHETYPQSSGDMVREMVMENGRYSDRAFIDAMVPHHQAAVDMAEVALENAGHEELRQLAEDVVSAQEAEIERLDQIREREFGSAESPSKMSEMDMQMMGMTDPQKLARQRPFDKAFIDAMIPHHRSAVAMAEVALAESENPEIKGVAQDIADAQRREIEQMQQWRREWYPQG
jgi:uncharacterized protein (DUF305 family)